MESRIYPQFNLLENVISISDDGKRIFISNKVDGLIQSPLVGDSFEPYISWALCFLKWDSVFMKRRTQVFISYLIHFLSQYSAIKNGYQLVSVFDFYILFVINHNLVHIYNKARYHQVSSLIIMCIRAVSITARKLHWCRPVH